MILANLTTEQWAIDVDFSLWAFQKSQHKQLFTGDADRFQLSKSNNQYQSRYL